MIVIRMCRHCGLPLHPDEYDIPTHPDGFITCDPKEVERASQAR